MKVLIVYAHYSPDSFTHAILEQVTKGLDDSPHSYKVNDLYASDFDPVFSAQDAVQFMHESLPEELLDEANPREAVLRSAHGPVRRLHGKAMATRQGQSRDRPRTRRASARGRARAAGAGR